MAILRPEHYDDWLGSKNPEFARALIELYRPEELSAYAAPKTKTTTTSQAEEIAQEDAQVQRTTEAEPQQASLFGF
ncbi:hypothetical protein D3C86_2003160 [compost metagenome]